MDTSQLAPFLNHVLTDATIPELPRHYRGKVRDNYDLPDGTRLLVATDRLSAFDLILTALPFKGEVLTQVARFWFDATADICANHVVDYPDPNVLRCRRLRIMPVEIVVRDYLAGTTSTSILSMYKAGRREMYGERFADGLRENQKLERTVITPTTKADQGDHDAPLTPAEIVGRGLLSRAQWEEASRLALALFARGREIAARRGLILVDTKYEFGFAEDGSIVLADEIHTPDSSRYWFAGTYPERFAAGQRPDSFDKDYVRAWVAARCDPYKEPVPPIPSEVILGAAAAYIGAYETITGRDFALPASPAPTLERIRRNLRPWFAKA
ncbi:MAG: phosphoribosylaminoimidazolesuccinocarboxamide synthase [Alphaproteobacteria bacterium]|nr:phosphoribosylaminoimidazolesuccinocarboxamide synthase [Alphaproteobacteria bacterium]